MTMKSFSIDHWWQEREVPQRYSYPAHTPIREALHAFLGKYEGGFTLYVQEEEATFALRPDLSTIFDDLPENLTALKRAERPVELDFFEQGTGVLVHLRSDPHRIGVRFELTSGFGEAYRTLWDEEIGVRAEDFFEAWRAFMGHVLDAIVGVSPAIASDPDFVRYRDAIAAL